MLYVAGEILVWIVLAALVGLVVGWLLRGLRGGVADDRYAMVVKERDDLRAAQDAMRADHERALADHAGLRAAHEQVVADRDAQVLGLAAAVADREALRSEVEAARAAVGQQTDALPVPDLDAAREVFGKAVKLDDLTLVEGIGPKIEELLHGAGISTWIGLARTPVERLQEVLSAAGDRFQMHDPGTWPQQAEMAAHGRWSDLKDLCDRLDGGRVVSGD
jgi:predicted flap endonuclease-1-like 5' DNA nuclease